MVTGSHFGSFRRAALCQTEQGEGEGEEVFFRPSKKEEKEPERERKRERREGGSCSLERPTDDATQQCFREGWPAGANVNDHAASGEGATFSPDEDQA